MADSPPAQKATDKDLIKAIEQRCTQSGIPVVPTKEIEKVDYIDIKKQAIARRLKKLVKQEKVSSLKIGRGWVWWIPDEVDSGGEADFSMIDWDSINPEEIPVEKLDEHPELSGPSYWAQLREDGQAIVRFGLYTFVLGILVLFAEQNIGLVSLTQFQEDVGTLSVVVGMFLIILGIVAAGISKAAMNIAEKGIDTWTKNKCQSLKSRFLSGVPIHISVEWKSKNKDQNKE